MGGVNNNRNYATTMGFGDWDGKEVTVAKPLLQGGIVSLRLELDAENLDS